jgi:murein DD-endopeptidase MepM/ murein hydrolase activator NlpD
MRTLSFLVVVVLLVAGVAWYSAGKAQGPGVQIARPGSVIGQTGDLEVLIDTPRGELSALDVTLEQGEKRIPIFSLAADKASSLARDGQRLKVARSIGKRQVPQLEAGGARIVIQAVRPVLFGLRQAETTASKDITVRLAPPGIAALSTHHYINHGGSEMVVYRVTPADAISGVRVGDREYPGYPASGAGIKNADPALRVAFFALLWNQPPNTPINLFARDEVGNEGLANFDYRVFDKKFRQSRIPVDDKFLARVVPAILQNTPELKVESADLVQGFLRINGDLRRTNGEKLTALARQTSPEILWSGAFKQLINSAVEGGFADQRTYVYNGKEIDHQVHLGYDLASTAAAPVLAANRGKVMHAGWLGIYGNCVILDHGMGLQSLYAHLSSIEVKAGDVVNQNDRLGRSGATGLAGGDHLHFTMLLAGNAVTPIDWWSPKWVQDRVERKLQEAGGTVSTAAAAR